MVVILLCLLFSNLFYIIKITATDKSMLLTYEIKYWKEILILMINDWEVFPAKLNYNCYSGKNILS